MSKIKKFFLHPPIWLERILSRFPSYRAWVIKEVFTCLAKDAVSDLNGLHVDQEDEQMQILFFIFSSLVALEFGIHIIYHAVTGKAGLEDPAFSYLTDIFKRR